MRTKTLLLAILLLIALLVSFLSHMIFAEERDGSPLINKGLASKQNPIVLESDTNLIYCYFNQNEGLGAVDQFLTKNPDFFVDEIRTMSEADYLHPALKNCGLTN